jgi:hypothetical protein
MRYVTAAPRKRIPDTWLRLFLPHETVVKGRFFPVAFYSPMRVALPAVFASHWSSAPETVATRYPAGYVHFA